MKEIYNTPQMEVVVFATGDVVVTSQLTEGGELNWENVEKPGWGQGSSW